MQKTVREKVDSYIEETGMLTGTTRVIAGVSGGADSVFLFHILLDKCEKQGIPFEVLHLHHGIRAEEADRDAAFVEALCQSYGVVCRVHYRDIPREAQRRHESLEEAGRSLRYALFSEEAAAVPGTRIALAHHKNDAAETLLFNLARGTGLRGLGSLRPIRDCYIRPLLAVTREELEAELIRSGLDWCEDSTNQENDAARNRIRHNILPYLTAEINAGSVEHLADTARIAGEAADFIRSEAIRRSAFYFRREDGSLVISVRMTAAEPRLMQEELVRLAVSETLETLKDISGLHIRLILELFERETGKFLNLPKGLTAEKRRNEVRLIRLPEAKKNTRKHGRVLKCKQSIDLL